MEIMVTRRYMPSSERKTHEDSWERNMVMINSVTKMFMDQRCYPTGSKPEEYRKSLRWYMDTRENPNRRILTTEGWLAQDVRTVNKIIKEMISEIDDDLAKYYTKELSDWFAFSRWVILGEMNPMILEA